MASHLIECYDAARAVPRATPDRADSAYREMWATVNAAKDAGCTWVEIAEAVGYTKLWTMKQAGRHAPWADADG